MRTHLMTAVTALLVITNTAMAQEEPKQTLFINMNVFDGTSEQLAENRRVLVESNLIKTIGDETLKANKGATVIDGEGRTLMSGLIDAHVHMAITEPIVDLRDNFDWMYWGATATAEAEKMLLSGMIRLQRVLIHKLHWRHFIGTSCQTTSRSRLTYSI